jgi:hypothetical protein
MSAIPTEIIDRYDTLLDKHTGLGICEHNPGTSLHHLRWMLWMLRGDMESGKANRWLGFIQGVLTVEGYINVSEERDFTRPFFQKEG